MISGWFHHSKYHTHLHNRKGWEGHPRAYIKIDAFLEAHRNLPIIFCSLELCLMAMCSCKGDENLGNRIVMTVGQS